MATYVDLYALAIADSVLKNRVLVATVKKAQLLIDTVAATQKQINWALSVLQGPESKAEELLLYVLAANSSATVAQIQNASDATLQTQINTAADAIIGGGV